MKSGRPFQWLLSGLWLTSLGGAGRPTLKMSCSQLVLDRLDPYVEATRRSKHSPSF